VIIPSAVVASAQGQDRSNFQAVTPWTGLDFGYCKATEGTTFLDATFAANWAGLAKAGIPRGVYHFFHPGLDPVAQARFFVATVKAQGLRPGDFLVADVEITAGGPLTRLLRALGIGPRLLPRQNVPAATAGLSAAGVDAAARAFCDEVASLAGPHCPVLVYTNRSVGSLLRSCTRYDLIIAWPSNVAPPSVAPWNTWRMWQWGIVSGTDRDAYNGTRADLDAWIASFKPKPPPPPPPSPVVVPPQGDDMFLPSGAGSTACYLVPKFVQGPTGPVPPSVMRFACLGPAELEFNFGNEGVWGAFTPALDFATSPWELVLAGNPVVKIRRLDKGTNPVSYDFA
jgi:GH25 family lysozyme M1 (1,4-beta-N-acetylmuramidase)